MSEATLKVQLGADIRRVSLKPIDSYPEFVKLVRSIFNVSELSGLHLSYADEDGDIINIRSQMDFEEARRYAVSHASFKVQVGLTNDLSQVAPANLPIYPPIAPEDIDLTSSFTDLMTDSMHKLESTRLADAGAEKSSAPFETIVSPILPTKMVRSPSASSAKSDASSSSVTSSNSSAKVEIKPDVAEAHFHQTLEELSDAQIERSESDSVLETVESKFKNALNAFVQFMESLKLDQKMRAVVAEFEPTFSKFEEKVISPINEFGERTSKDLQSEMSSFQQELSQLRSRIQARLDQLSGSESKSQSSGSSSAADAPYEAPNAIEDLNKLDDMGFTDRRRNLELLATHKGDINAVVASLLE